MEKNKYIEPYKDMFNLYNLIKRINAGYGLYFDKKEKCFLILNKYKNNEVCLKFFDFNDSIFKRLQKSQICFCKEIFKELEIENEKISNTVQRQAKDDAISRLEDLVKYSVRTNEISQSDINKILR